MQEYPSIKILSVDLNKTQNKKYREGINGKERGKRLESDVQEEEDSSIESYRKRKKNEGRKLKREIK